MSKQRIPRVPESIDFPEAEKKILTLWQDIDAFQTSLKQSKGKPRYSFFDGPPFATGLPHYGHILAGTIKDVVTRYAHQQGFHVVRRFGWDCHGLPVEYEIDKMLNIKGPDDVMKMGIDKYNAECRKIVGRYSSEWEIIMTRLGRWIDFKNDYKSMYPWYMESIWWIFKQLYEKGLVYQGNKVMPYSTTCNTPLSNFESGQNYKDVVDPTVTVSLPLINDRNQAALLIWTTTPWTLPSNLAACVNPNLTYARVLQKSTNKHYILLEERIAAHFNEEDVVVEETFQGKVLKDLQYEPIFPYFKEMRETHKAFRVLCDEYVTSESGTGIVHQAAYFGEDDYRVCLANGIITKDMEPVCPLDASGRFIKPVTDFEGQYIKDADKNIIAKLKDDGKLFHQAQMSLIEVSRYKSFEGFQVVFSHESKILGCMMKFGVYLPPQIEKKKLPVIYWLSGLTCSESNFIEKAGAQRYAAEYGVVIVNPDTSPRGLNIPGDKDAWDFGEGAGFYVDATEEPWSKNYNMYSYVTKELREIITSNFNVLGDKQSIMGHSMGGHGALICALKNPGLYKSVSAFAPICNPSKCPWGLKAFSGYLGPQETSNWSDWDATELVVKYEGPMLPILIEQGSLDKFLEHGQLLPENFQESCKNKNVVSLKFNNREGYDHSYFFIASFIEEHIKYHLTCIGC